LHKLLLCRHITTCRTSNSPSQIKRVITQHSCATQVAAASPPAGRATAPDGSHGDAGHSCRHAGQQGPDAARGGEGCAVCLWCDVCRGAAAATALSSRC
jgi:hypothetical protein